MGDAERATLVRALARVRRDRRAAVLWVEHDWRLSATLLTGLS